MAGGVQIETSSNAALVTPIRQNIHIPWYIWCGVLSLVSPSIGLPWDIAWHRSNGRDSFWIAPHFLVYACGLFAALSCGYLILFTTFGNSARLKATSVDVFRFKAPLGAFVAAWGGIAMLTSAFFDDWWHAAYGLDVQILSPPHALLLLGLQTIMFGFFILTLGEMNRTSESQEHQAKIFQRLLIFMGGLILALFMIELTEVTERTLLHVVYAYKAIALPIPALFAFFSRTIRHRWTATWCATLFTLMVIAQILIFPLIPAAPKLGPVYIATTHLIPTHFPILIVAPALALDLLWQRCRSWNRWQLALLSGLIFTVVLVAVEWPFANILMTKWSENRFLGTGYFSYFEPTTSNTYLGIFYGPTTGVPLLRGLIKTALYASASTWLGLALGGWLKKVHR